MLRRTLSILAAFVVTAAITVSSVHAQSSRGPEGVTLVSIKDAIAKAIGAAGGTIKLTQLAQLEVKFASQFVAAIVMDQGVETGNGVLLGV